MIVLNIYYFKVYVIFSRQNQYLNRAEKYNVINEVDDTLIDLHVDLY